MRLWQAVGYWGDLGLPLTLPLSPRAGRGEKREEICDRFGFAPSVEAVVLTDGAFTRTGLIDEC